VNLAYVSDDLLERLRLNLGQPEHRPTEKLGGIVLLGVVLEAFSAVVAALDPNPAFQLDGGLALQVGPVKAPTSDGVKAML
jgi:hypothetical protein